MEDMLNALSLADEEESNEIRLAPLPRAPTTTYEHCLIGMFVTLNLINFVSMKNVLADLWHPIGGMDIQDIRVKWYLFHFYNEVDVERVWNGSPWYFNKHLLMWDKIKIATDPLTIPLLKAYY